MQEGYEKQRKHPPYTHKQHARVKHAVIITRCRESSVLVSGTIGSTGWWPWV